MASALRSQAMMDGSPFPIIFENMPILYEDEEEGDMGESSPHVDSDEILHICLKAHMASRPEYRVFSNMNCYYRKGPPHPKTGSPPYFSADTMIVRPSRALGDEVTSYEIGRDGPPPVLVAEVLSQRSYQQSDLKRKIKLYAQLGIPEYLLADPAGRFLQERLLLKRLRPGRTWKNEQDRDGGVTSTLGFRVIIESDGKLRVLDAATGKHYIRPDEADTAVRAAEAQIESLRAEVERLKGKAKKNKRTKGK